MSDLKLEEMNLNDFTILISLLDKNDATIGKSKLKGLTKAEIASRSKFSVAKVGQVIKEFLSLGYLDEGLKKGRAKTFFITYKGLEKIVEFKEDIIV